MPFLPKITKALILANVSPEKKKQALEDERIRNSIEGKFGQGKRRFSLGRVMAQLPHTSLTSIALTFLVMNLSTLLLRLFWGFLCQFFKITSFPPVHINKIDDYPLNSPQVFSRLFQQALIILSSSAFNLYSMGTPDAHTTRVECNLNMPTKCFSACLLIKYQ